MTNDSSPAPERDLGLQERLSSEIDFLTSLIRAGTRRKGSRAAKDATESDYEDFVRVAELLRIWHTEAPYIDREGDPLPMTFSEKPPSIHSLAAQVAGPTDAHRLCELLKQSTVLVPRRKSGMTRWTPRGRSAVNANLDSLVAAYCLTTLQRMATTLRRNVARETTIPGVNEFERSVDGHSIAPEDIPAFSKFLAVQGQYFVDAVDDWLIKRTNRAKITASEHVRVPVSVHAFAWTGATSRNNTVKRPRKPKKKP